MFSKLPLILIAVVQLGFGAWAGAEAMKDTTQLISALAMMGMFGSIFHSAVIFASLTFPTQVRRVITLLLLVWHIPEAIFIATLGMGIPQSEQLTGIIIHASFSVLALLSWYLSKNE